MKAPYFPLFVNNWLGSARIAALTPAEENAYFRLLLYEWNDEKCSLPEDDESLSTLSRLKSAWPKSKQRVLQFFELHDGRYYNEKLLSLWIAAQELRAKQSAKGVKGMLSRWHNTAITPVITQLSLADNTAITPTPTPTPTDKNKIGSEPTKTVSDVFKSPPVSVPNPEWQHTVKQFVAMTFTPAESIRFSITGNKQGKIGAQDIQRALNTIPANRLMSIAAQIYAIRQKEPNRSESYLVGVMRNLMK